MFLQITKYADLLKNTKIEGLEIWSLIVKVAAIVHCTEHGMGWDTEFECRVHSIDQVEVYQYRV